MSKIKISILIIVVLIFFISLFGYLIISNKDCDNAAQMVQSVGWKFSQLEGEVGRADGVAVEWTIRGCLVSDDFYSWRVTPWGTVKKL